MVGSRVNRERERGEVVCITMELPSDRTVVLVKWGTGLGNCTGLARCEALADVEKARACDGPAVLLLVRAAPPPQPGTPFEARRSSSCF